MPGLDLACIVTRRATDVQRDWPAVNCLACASAALANPAIDLVVIATPNASHFELAQAALQAGKHVVVDKPCTVTLAETDALLALARQRGRVFGPPEALLLELSTPASGQLPGLLRPTARPFMGLAATTWRHTRASTHCDATAQPG